MTMWASLEIANFKANTTDFFASIDVITERITIDTLKKRYYSEIPNTQEEVEALELVLQSFGQEEFNKEYEV